MRKELIVICMSFFSFCLFGQEELHSRKKKAIADYKEASERVMVGQNAEAITLLLSAIKRDESFDEAILLLMSLYLDNYDKTQALNLYNNSIDELESKFQSKVNFDIAKFYWSAGDYDNAQKYFERIGSEHEGIKKEDYELLKESIVIGKDSMSQEAEIEFESLTSKMNEFDMQYFPSIDASGLLVFTARDKRWGGHEQIMMTRARAEGWGEPIQISESINSNQNEGTASISADGKTLVFTGCNRQNGIGSCDLFVSYKIGGIWSEAKLLPTTINTRHWESQPSLTSNGNTLYFVSTRPGKGGQDLYTSTRIDGEWTPAIPLDELNTPKDDASPFIYPDDVTLFFASNGRPGLGRFDLYRVEKGATGWTAPMNLGAPINNEQDQIGYCIGLDGWAYFSTSMTDGRIKMKRFRVPENFVPEIRLTTRVVYLKDSITKNAIDGLVTISNENVDEQLTQVAIGRFEDLSNGVKVKYYASATGYYNKVVESSSDTLTIELRPLEVDSVLAGPIYFSSNEWQIQEKYIKALDKLVSSLKEYPELVITIEGYTDVIGSTEDNLELSKKRVEEVHSYLIKNGVPEENMKKAFFGESKSANVARVTIDEDSDRKVLIRLKGIKN